MLKTTEQKILAITNDLNSPIAQLGDVSLQTSVSEFMNIGSVAGQVSQLYLCDVLAREYEKLNKVDVDKIKRASFVRSNEKIYLKHKFKKNFKLA